LCATEPENGTRVPRTNPLRDRIEGKICWSHLLDATQQQKSILNSVTEW
jgi:hypothetical protein